MPQIKDISGQKFGYLTILSLRAIGDKGKRRTLCICQCDCGNKLETRLDNLKSGNTKSCGCWKESGICYVKHGLYDTQTYQSYTSIKQRCLNSKNAAWDDYGGRGIKICSYFKNSLENFVQDVGERPNKKYSIDRIDNNAHYSCGHCPECIRENWASNCRWATKKEQTRNTRSNRWLEYKGETKCLQDWAEILGLSRDTILHRLKKGWSVERTFATPTKSSVKILEN